MKSVLLAALMVCGLSQFATADEATDANTVTTAQSSITLSDLDGQAWVQYYPGRPVVCYARNARGVVFRGESYSLRRAQDLALSACYNYPSRFCREEGCR